MKILKFTASWCGPCKVLTENMKGIEAEAIDIDTSPELCAKYNVRSVPTLIMTDDDGNELKRRTGSGSTTQIQEWINASN